MKERIFTFVYLLLFSLSILAQTPQTINYQGVARDNSGNVIANQMISLKLSILSGTASGPSVYVETHVKTTDGFGLFALQIGQGSLVSGSFSTISWGTNTYYLKVEIDPTGGSSYQLVGTNQFVSVPYALYAGESDAVNIAGTSGQTLRYNGNSWVANNLLYNDSTHIGIGTSTPTALLHTNGTGFGEGNVLFVGSWKSTLPGALPVSGAGTRMMWYPDKAAFRAGQVDGLQWNKDSIGNFSVAMGFNTKAKKNYSTAMGSSTTASGIYSTAIGSSTTASGNYSTAMGISTTASGIYSTAIGYQTTASGTSSTAMGGYSTASGNYSTTMGHYTTAPSGYETVIGRYNTDYTPASTTTWYATDRLFVVGDGVGSTSKSDAMIILKNGNIGFGTSIPNALIHTNGTGTGEGNVLFEGSFKYPNTGATPASGAGTRMMWYPDKASFRAGYVTGTHWDKDSIGNFSVAMGYNTKAKHVNSTALGGQTTASGNTSTAMGSSTTASGAYSTAMGYETDASGYYSTAMGLSTTASGDNSTAMGVYANASGDQSTAMGSFTTASGNTSTAIGNNTTASGNVTTAMGSGTTAPSGYETVIGCYNTDYTPASTTTWNTADRLFVIGNGTGSSTRSNAITVLKSGCIGLHTVTNPTYALELPNSSTIGIGLGRAYAWTTYSDKRIKSEIRSLPYGINEVMKLNPVSYNQHGSNEIDGKLIIDEASVPNIGFIAQDVFTLIPEVVNKPENNENALWSMSYEKLVPILVKGMQEQQQMIEKHNKTMDEMKMIIEQQQKQIDQLLNK